MPRRRGQTRTAVGEGEERMHGQVRRCGRGSASALMRRCSAIPAIDDSPVVLRGRQAVHVEAELHVGPGLIAAVEGVDCVCRKEQQQKKRRRGSGRRREDASHHHYTRHYLLLVVNERTGDVRASPVDSSVSLAFYKIYSIPLSPALSVSL